MIRLPFIKPRNAKAAYLQEHNVIDVVAAEAKVWRTVETFSDDLNKALTGLLRKYSLELKKARKDTHYWQKRCERLEKEKTSHV